MRQMDITVILCTYNRCRVLAKALDSLAASRLPETVEWEVLVVDNNSTDQSRQVVEEFYRAKLGHVRYLFEPQPGKSYALNSGIREARGKILAFIDDDVTVEPTWLQNLVFALRDGEWVGAGGRILTGKTIPFPHWLAPDGPYSMGGVLAASFDLGDKAGPLDRAPYGTNMAFRKEMFEKYGGFRMDLGPSPNNEIPRPNEDTEFGRRLMAAGERLWYEPSAVVHHEVPEKRLRKEYFLAWWFDFGRAMVREWGRGPDLLGIPRPYFNILKMVMTTMPRLAAPWMLAWQPQRRFFFKTQLWKVAGEVTEFYRLARRRDLA
jgi:glycosyltransferase involved in cell wall biosynthesis